MRKIDDFFRSLSIFLVLYFFFDIVNTKFNFASLISNDCNKTTKTNFETIWKYILGHFKTTIITNLSQPYRFAKLNNTNTNIHTSDIHRVETLKCSTIKVQFCVVSSPICAPCTW